MTVDPELLADRVCPWTEGLRADPRERRDGRALVEKCCGKFRGKEPKVAEGFSSKRADPVYPIVPVPVPAEEAHPESEAR